MFFKYFQIFLHGSVLEYALRTPPMFLKKLKKNQKCVFLSDSSRTFEKIRTIFNG